MGINRDKSYSIKSLKSTLEYEENIYKYYSKADKELINKMIERVNNSGYFIEYFYQLEWMDKNDFDLINPIIMDCADKFENIRIRNSLYHTLGCRGNYNATNYLLNEFRKKNEPYVDDIAWNSTRRGATSSSIAVIRDKGKIDDYIKLIEDNDTRNDCFFIIILLGKLKVKRVIPLLLQLLNEDKMDIQSAAIQALFYFRKDIDLHSILEPFVNSEHYAIRTNARKALK